MFFDLLQLRLLLFHGGQGLVPGGGEPAGDGVHGRLELLELFEGPAPAEEGHAHAALVRHGGDDLGDAHLPREMDVRCAAGAGIGALDAHHPDGGDEALGMLAKGHVLQVLFGGVGRSMYGQVPANEVVGHILHLGK